MFDHPAVMRGFVVDLDWNSCCAAYLRLVSGHVDTVRFYWQLAGST